MASRLTPPAGSEPPAASSLFAALSRGGGHRQVLAADEAAVGQDHGALDGVAQLADVAGPRVGEQLIACLARDARRRAADGFADLGEKRVGQLQDVVEPLAQRRQRDLEDAEPVVEVLAELAALHRRVQVAVGGGNHADVGVEHARAAEAHELALLEHAQQLGLHRRRHLADLVEEEHAAVGLLDASGLGRRPRR